VLNQKFQFLWEVSWKHEKFLKSFNKSVKTWNLTSLLSINDVGTNKNKISGNCLIFIFKAPPSRCHCNFVHKNTLYCRINQFYNFFFFFFENQHWTLLLNFNDLISNCIICIQSSIDWYFEKVFKILYPRTLQYWFHYCYLYTSRISSGWWLCVSKS